MASDKYLIEAVRMQFAARGVAAKECRMFGGVCFMVDDKMCAGVTGERLMLRVDPEISEELLIRPGSAPMDFTGRSMRGFLYVHPEGLPTDEALADWLGLALEFNPRAKRSAKRGAKK